MIDFHCHLDLYKQPLVVFNEANRQNIYILAVTTSPKAYIKTSMYFQGADNVIVSLGFHPELVAERRNEKDLFLQLLPNCRFVGEIGIDGTGKNRNTLAFQASFFKEAVCEMEREENKIISIHSRGAVREVLSILEKSVSTCIPILHWFTGTVKEMEHALSMGCWFSINPKMCHTKSGQDIIKNVPIKKIIPETDGPFAQHDNIPYMPWDNTVLQHIAALHGISTLDAENRMHENLKEMLRHDFFRC